MKRDCNIFFCGEGIWKAKHSKEWMEKTGSDPHGIRIMMEKDQIYPIFITNIYFGAGNILKQDMLSLGGDVVVHKFFVNGKMESGSIVILGTAKQYRFLQTKMYAQHWGLKELAEDLKILVENIKTYREMDEMVTDNVATDFDEQFSEIDLSKLDLTQKKSIIEEVMAKLPLNRAKKVGFISIPIEKFNFGLTEMEKKEMLFYPAISRGYYLKLKGE